MFGQTSFGGGGTTSAFGGVTLGGGATVTPAASAINPMKDLEVSSWLVHISVAGTVENRLYVIAVFINNSMTIIL